MLSTSLPGSVTNVHPLGRFTIKTFAAPDVRSVAEMIIGVVFVPVVPIAPVDVAVALVIVAAETGAAAITDKPVANKMAAVVTEKSFLNISDPLIEIS
jgi:ABC-type phosphate/phosphonate transport system permease subunit